MTFDDRVEAMGSIIEVVIYGKCKQNRGLGMWEIVWKMYR